ncbi:hypothetical protein A2Z23_00880 [Candidatus Curtissbacteria bacterium RBG_16_39_7]|uniref:Sucrose phosphatase-like domain-containing protein n=1 Tax=Candidatus Curtissbacteria bacterium RBG_16_39_7 TaxID=1797707 RepID=A0A1F5G221_9BACT|nr:MAG: hypothetical protein A2Z23_00880 [Candidatus Curtissbacteria bacterium RBG_16_39_7]
MSNKEVRFKEKKAQRENCFFFDVDGVLTDKRKVNPEVLAEIARLLENSPVGFITGRSVVWLSEKVLPQLENLVPQPNFLNNLVVVAEKGAVLLEYQDGKRRITTDRRVKIPRIITQKAREIVQWKEFSPYLFFDETKQTMVSIEMYEDGDFEEQKQALGKLTSLLQKMVVDQKLDNRLEVLESTIAADIQSKTVGKGPATKRAWRLLKKRGIVCREVFAFGDSKEDLEIGEELAQIGVPFNFVFVGSKRLEKVGFTVTRTVELHDRGVLGFIRGLHLK